MYVTIIKIKLQVIWVGSKKSNFTKINDLTPSEGPRINRALSGMLLMLGWSWERAILNFEYVKKGCAVGGWRCSAINLYLCILWRSTWMENLNLFGLDVHIWCADEALVFPIKQFVNCLNRNLTWEFDPGSERTLAAGLTHASRTKVRSLLR